MRCKRKFYLVLVLVIFTLLEFPMASLANWKVIFKTETTVTAEAGKRSGKTLVYKGFQFREGMQYGIVLKKIRGNFNLHLYNPGNRLVSKGKRGKQGDLILVVPKITEKGYSIKVSGKKGQFQLMVSQTKHVRKRQKRSSGRSAR